MSAFQADGVQKNLVRRSAKTILTVQSLVARQEKI
jgi:hypothetical protein